MSLTIEEIESWLRQTDPQKLKALRAQADRLRRETVGDAVHLRGLIEISNVCVRTCAYCGISSKNTGLQRYRMTAEEILECTQKAVEYEYGTVVMQAGEDYGIEGQWLAEVIRRIKQTTPLAVTLSLGERPIDDLNQWRQAGADRYLLRFETSDPALYNLIHPPLPGQKTDRMILLRRIRELGYETGTGVMVGIPGQTWLSLAHDIDLFRQMDMDMIGIGPYIPDPHTPLGRGEIQLEIDPAEQVPNDEITTCKVIALTRLVCPQANIPSTTALAAINRHSGRQHGLQCGANVVMPNLTPEKYRRLYQIYPGKAGSHETAEQINREIRDQLVLLGRSIGIGPGGRKRSLVSSTPYPRR